MIVRIKTSNYDAENGNVVFTAVICDDKGRELENLVPSTLSLRADDRLDVLLPNVDPVQLVSMHS